MEGVAKHPWKTKFLFTADLLISDFYACKPTCAIAYVSSHTGSWRRDPS
jgi:hypothetical protein